MNSVRPLHAALAALGLAVVATCGSSSLPPPPPGTPLELHAAGERGPRIPNGAIFAASDLTTLRSFIDAGDTGLAGQLGGTGVGHMCMPPYTADGGPCWPDVTSAPGDAYVALDAQTGFCTDPGTPRLAVSGTHIELQVPYTVEFGCHINGSLAAPSAALFWFPTRGLKPGLYSVSFTLASTGDVYRSDSTYLSVPGPPAGSEADLDGEATAALTSVVGMRRGIFSVARVDGAQLAALCGRTVVGPAYLVTYETETPRQMVVALAGASPQTCATTRV